MRRRDVIKAGFGLTASGLVSSIDRAAAQSKTILKAADVHPAGYPTVAATEALGKKLSEATGGRLKILMFASMTLGAEKETIEQTQFGAIQLVRVSVGALGPIVGDLNVLNMPFLCRDTTHMQAVLDGPIGQELLDAVTNNASANLVGLCWMDAGARSFYDTKRPIKNLADMKSLKVRVIGNPMFVDMANALGANGVAMGYDQVFSSLQTGVIDGAENNLPSYVFDNHYTAAKYFSLTQHLIVPEILLFSRRAWNNLTPTDQGLVKKFAREAQAEARVLWNEYERKALDKAKSAGCEIIEIADKKPFQDAVKPVWDKYGPKYSALVKRIQDA